jgi:hypothetical protein
VSDELLFHISDNMNGLEVLKFKNGFALSGAALQQCLPSTYSLTFVTIFHPEVGVELTSLRVLNLRELSGVDLGESVSGW